MNVQRLHPPKRTHWTNHKRSRLILRRASLRKKIEQQEMPENHFPETEQSIEKIGKCGTSESLSHDRRDEESTQEARRRNETNESPYRLGKREEGVVPRARDGLPGAGATPWKVERARQGRSRKGNGNEPARKRNRRNRGARVSGKQDDTKPLPPPPVRGMSSLVPDYAKRLPMAKPAGRRDPESSKGVA